jgi:uncharacterized membrane protein YfcA
MTSGLEFLVIPVVALLASLLTLFAGFGLGTLLMPVVALFFPLPVAVAMTAAVHLANNLFKFGLLGRHVDGRVLLRFGVPALVASGLGAWTLHWLGDLPEWWRYTLFGREFAVTPLKCLVGVVILIFVVLEGSKRLRKATVDPRYLPIGGVLSGFFGGLSGHQGALRSMFLARLELAPQAFVGTGVALALLIDLARIGVYASEFDAQWTSLDWRLLLATTLAAFAGAWLGARWLRKTTMPGIQRAVAVLLVAVGLGLIAGVL